jgi:hypothetical protein
MKLFKEDVSHQTRASKKWNYWKWVPRRISEVSS